MCITVKQMMQIEENGHQMGFLRKFMMENAGAAVAKRIIDYWQLDTPLGIHQGKIHDVLVVAGLGNNGGDSLVIARHLAGYGLHPIVLLLGRPEHIKTEECSLNYHLLSSTSAITQRTGSSVAIMDDEDFGVIKKLEELKSKKFDIVIDGILGTGISGKIREPQASAITFINESNVTKDAQIVSVDVPSGLNADTGETNQVCVYADYTYTFHRMKVGMQKRTDVCGEIFVEKIGIPPEAEIGVL